MNHSRIVLPAITISIALSLPSTFADDFSGKDFSLRFAAALSHFEPYADVAAKGGSSAALPFGSSNNPASIVWHFPDSKDYETASINHYRALVSGQYSNVPFDNGTQLHFASSSITFGTAETGVLRLDGGVITSNERTVRNLPADFGFNLGGGRLNYAKKLGNFSMGATASYAQSTTTFSSGGTDLVDATKDIWNFRLGGLWSPKERWFIGLVTTYIYGPTETSTLTRLSSGSRVRLTSSDATHQFTVQPGVAYQWRHFGVIHADYQFVSLANDTGSLTENRFLIGADFPIGRSLYLRGGGFAEIQGNVGWTAGIGLYLHPQVLIDLAYQNNNFPEVSREFGRSQTVNASVCVRW